MRTATDVLSGLGFTKSSFAWKKLSSISGDRRCAGVASRAENRGRNEGERMVAAESQLSEEFCVLTVSSMVALSHRFPSQNHQCMISY